MTRPLWKDEWLRVLGPRHGTALVGRLKEAGNQLSAKAVKTWIQGAPLEKAACVARLTSPEPGVYQRSRVGELLRCPWHGWEFDMRNGQSWFDPKRVKVRSYPVAVESGEELQKGPYVAETFAVHVEDSYVIIET